MLLQEGKIHMNKKDFLCCVMIIAPSFLNALEENGRSVCSPFEVIESESVEGTGEESELGKRENVNKYNESVPVQFLLQLKSEVQELRERVEKLGKNNEKKTEIKFSEPRHNPCERITQLIGVSYSYGRNLTRNGWKKLFPSVSDSEKKQK